MFTDTQIKLIAVVVLLAVGFGVGRYTVPEKSTEQTIVEKELKKEETVIVREETRPDGTKIKETTNTTKKETAKRTETIKIVESKKPDWKVAGLVGYNFNKVKPVYGAVVERRILGNIFVGAWGTTDQQAGLSVSLEF